MPAFNNAAGAIHTAGISDYCIPGMIYMVYYYHRHDEYRSHDHRQQHDSRYTLQSQQLQTGMKITAGDVRP